MTEISKMRKGMKMKYIVTERQCLIEPYADEMKIDPRIGPI